MIWLWVLSVVINMLAIATALRYRALARYHATEMLFKPITRAVDADTGQRYVIRQVLDSERAERRKP